MKGPAQTRAGFSTIGGRNAVNDPKALQGGTPSEGPRLAAGLKHGRAAVAVVSGSTTSAPDGDGAQVVLSEATASRPCLRPTANQGPSEGVPPYTASGS